MTLLSLFLSLLLTRQAAAAYSLGGPWTGRGSRAGGGPRLALEGQQENPEAPELSSSGG